MKRRFCAVFTIFVFTLSLLAGCDNGGSLKKVTLNEVAHSIFYAPQYVAIQNGYFKEEGLDITLVNGNGADKVMTAVLSGSADIGFMGSEASIYVHQQGKEDYIVNFAQLTQRAGNFLVGKEADPNFSFDKLKGKTVLGGREGGMPEMVFEYILKKKGIDPKKDLTIVQNISFGLTAEAFASGKGDYTVEFEPFAATLEAEKKGAVVASLGVESGKVPYTAYSAKKSYLEKNPKVIQSFTNALQKGMDYVQTHTPQEIAAVIAPQFPGTKSDALISIVKRYKDQDTWKNNLVFEESSFTLLQDILESAGVIQKRADYNVLVTTDFATKAERK